MLARALIVGRCALPLLTIVIAIATSIGTARAASFATIYTGSGIQPGAGAAANGTLFLVDPYGGASGMGAVYGLRLKTHTLALIYAFTGASDGGVPNRRLQVGANGDLYGTTRSGGANGGGTVFDLSLGGTLTTIHAFAPATDGAVPQDGLALDANGTGYGTTSMAAVSPGNGTIFAVTQTGFAVQYYFQSENDGHCPFTGLQRDAAGNMFGTTVGFGFGGQPLGSVWEFTAQGQLKTLYAFTNGVDGEWPQITPAIDASDNIWGVSAVRNGAAYAGAVWSINAHGFAIRHQFTGGSDGWQPNGPLLLGSNGIFYGTTVGGGSAAGSNGYGTVFSISHGGAFAVVHAFKNGRDGAHPTGGLVQSADGRIFGGTQSGTIFAITP